MAELRSEVGALRAENQRLERRLERLELRESVSRTASARAPTRADTSADVPSLSVVKLKPRQDPAPRLPVEVEVVEPPAEILGTSGASSRADDSEEVELPAEVLEAAFDNGVQSLRTGNLAGGVEALLRFADENRRHNKADNALYFGGVGLVGMEAYAEAARAFERVVSEYPAGDAVVDALLKLAECHLRLNRPTQAREVYERVVNGYPGTAAANQAMGRLHTLSTAMAAEAGSP